MNSTQVLSHVVGSTDVPLIEKPSARILMRLWRAIRNNPH